MRRREVSVAPARQLAGFIARFTKGGGNQVGSIRLAKASDLDKPGVKALMAQALATATKPIPPKGRSPIVIKSISGKQRPRRPQASSGK